jgi:hypothetical protein
MREQKGALELEIDRFMDEHDDRRRGAVEGQFAEMGHQGQHRKIRYAIML